MYFTVTLVLPAADMKEAEHTAEAIADRDGVMLVSVVKARKETTMAADAFFRRAGHES